MKRGVQIVILVGLIIFLYGYGIREAFTTRDASEVPSKLLLKDWYPEHKPDATYSDEQFGTQWINYPIFPAHSTKINNLKQWRKPNNGQCIEPEMCGNVYEDRKVVLPQQPEVPGFNKGLRVNYYNVCLL